MVLGLPTASGQLVCAQSLNMQAEAIAACGAESTAVQQQALLQVLA
jgi:hypothetical protein